MYIMLNDQAEADALQAQLRALGIDVEVRRAHHARRAAATARWARVPARRRPATRSASLCGGVGASAGGGFIDPRLAGLEHPGRVFVAAGRAAIARCLFGAGCGLDYV